jgi:Zn-dependent peptidase ImmA (M78 family)
LHSRIGEKALRDESRIRDSTRDLVTHRIEASKPRSLLEWQANKFAAGVLMPRRTVRQGLIQVQKARGISRNLGTIWLDRNASSFREHQITITHLAELYHVSRSVARFRLRELDILQVDAKSMPTRATDSLASVLAELFQSPSLRATPNDELS